MISKKENKENAQYAIDMLKVTLSKGHRGWIEKELIRISYLEIDWSVLPKRMYHHYLKLNNLAEGTLYGFHKSYLNPD